MRNFQILIVSSVKICKQCKETASVSGGLRLPDSVSYSAQMKIIGAATACFTFAISHFSNRIALNL